MGTSALVLAVITLLYAKHALSFFDFISVEEIKKWLHHDDETDYYFDKEYYDDDDAASDENEGHVNDSSTASPTVATTIQEKTSVCGRQLVPLHRIVGGSNATFGRWPWQVSLHRRGHNSTFTHRCGAALLNENWVITAAHCVHEIPKSEFQLRMGELDITNLRGPRRWLKTVIAHPNFDLPTLEYDLALLGFDRPVRFQPNVSPICLPDSDEAYVGRTAFVTGWGALKEAGGPLATTLQEVSLPVMDNSICESMYKIAGYVHSIPNIFICAGLPNGGRDACQGDSGGPMVIQRPDKRFLLAGIASWGGVCGAPNQPGVYTRVSEFRHWIDQFITT